MKTTRAAVLLSTLLLLPALVKSQDDSKRYRTGQIKVGDRILADAVGLGRPDTCTVIGTTELTGSYMPGYTNQYLIRCDHKAWSSVAATGDKVRLAGQANVVENGAAAAQQPPAGANAYGTRNPRTCSPVTGSMISTTQAAQLVACSQESESRDTLYLLDDVRVTSIRASRYDPYTQTGFTNMDTRVPPYAIEGSFVQWQCNTVDAKFSSAYNNFGKNCNRYNQHDAKGYCYKMRDGTWHCNMSSYSMTDADKQFRVAPPR